MKKFEGILICSDLDGTLLSSERTIPSENLKAIEYFKSEGGAFTVISGRVPDTVGDICEVLKPNAPIGCFNGCGVYDYQEKKYEWVASLPSEALELVKHVDENMPDVGIQMNTADTIYISKYNDAMETFKRYRTVARHYNDIEGPFVKVVFADCDVSKIYRLIEMIGRHPLADKFDFVRSEDFLYELLPKNIGKGTALEKIAQILGCTKTVAIGDFYNDVSMLKAAKVGVAVANACDEAKAVADVITVSNDENALAKLIDDLDKGKISF